MLNAKDNHQGAKQMKMGSSSQHVWNFVWVSSENSEREVT
jgi:hypothetical protein